MLKPADPPRPGPDDDRPIGELVSRLVDEGKAYAQAEIGVAKAIASAKADGLKVPAILLAAAFLLSQAAATVLAVALSMGSVPATLAQAPAIASDDSADLNDLLAVLADETEVATRSRENADFVPGIISVLSGDEARALGARTVLDAMALLPGVQVDRGGNGAATLQLRGMSAFFNSGNVKLLIDGLDTSFGVAGQNSSTLLIPKP